MDVMEREHPGTLLRVRQGVQALLDAGKLHPAVEQRYALEQASEALASLENRTALGKVVVSMANALVRVGREFQALVLPRGSVRLSRRGWFGSGALGMPYGSRAL